jgi:ketosteroid isomerase-like protein
MACSAMMQKIIEQSCPVSASGVVYTNKPEIMKTTAFFVRIVMAWAVLYCQSGFAQTSLSPSLKFQNSPNEKIARAYYTAFEKKDWNLMEPILADGFTFTSPLDDHISLKLFKERCWPNADKIKRFDVVKLFANGDEAYVIYNGWTTDGKLFRNSDYFKFKDGKISEYECFFGPGINYPDSGK